MAETKTKSIHPLKDGKNDWSSKRISSALCLLFSLSIPFWWAPVVANRMQNPPSMAMIIGLFLSAAAAFQGISWGSEAAQAFAQKVTGIAGMTSSSLGGGYTVKELGSSETTSATGAVGR